MRLRELTQAVEQLLRGGVVGGAGGAGAQRVAIEDLTLNPSSFSVPIPIGDPISVVPGIIYTVVGYAELDAPDEESGDNRASQIMLHLSGASVWSQSYGETTDLPYFGGQVGEGLRQMANDALLIDSGDSLQFALHMEDPFGAQSDFPVVIHRLTLSIIG